MTIGPGPDRSTSGPCIIYRLFSIPAYSKRVTIARFSSIPLSTRLLARLLGALIGVWFAAGTPALAQAGVVGARLAACVAPARPALSPRDLLTRPRGFDCATPQTAFGSGDFDVISGPVPRVSDPRQSIRIRTASLWQDSTTLFALYADGAIVSLTTDTQAATQHLQLGAVISRRLAVRDAPLVRLLWRIRGSGNMRGILLGPSVATAAEGARSNLVLGAIYAGFAGLCLALLIYNLALWVALRHRFQLAYCAMVATLALYAFSSSGALAWAFPAIGSNDRIRLNYLALAIAVVAALSFARSFFEDRVFEGWLTRLSNAIAALVLIAAGAFVVFAPVAPRVLDRFYSTSFLLVLLAVAPILWRAWRRRSNYLWLFALGWATPIAFAAMRVASSLNLVGWGFWVDNSTIASMTVEAILSSLAIAYRIHLLSRERDEAREQEIAARLLAATDPLTGLLNRRAFLEQIIGRDGDQTLLLADIDHFKRVNETIGHDGGDEVLRVFSRALRASVPRDALIARIGGEEFAIVAPASSDLSAATVLDGLRNERMPFDLTVTASIGTCTGSLARDIDWKRLYRQADGALFEAKAAGRDRARHATILAA